MGTGSCTVDGVRKKPVAASQSKRSDRIFGQIDIDRDGSIVGIADEFGPLLKQVDRIASPEMIPSHV